MTQDAPHPRVGRTVRPAIGRLAMKIAGWRLVGSLPPTPKFVAVVAPHTSNWDFFVGLAVLFTLDVEVHWLGKHTIFRGPVGKVLRGLGGIPVRRAAAEGVVSEVVDMMRSAPTFILALAPEGTRGKVGQWRTGFYRIAESGGVPILPVWFDFGRREVGFGEPMLPTGDLPGDLAALQALFRPEMARHPRLHWASDDV